MGESLSPVGGRVCHRGGPALRSTRLHCPLERRLAAVISVRSCVIFQFEATDQLGQPCRLPGKYLRSSRKLFGLRRVGLGDMVHLRYRGVHLFYPGAVPRRCDRDLMSEIFAEAVLISAMR
jgi:hypothetical protein